MFKKNKWLASIASAVLLVGVGFTTTMQLAPQMVQQDVRADSWINDYIDQNGIQPVPITYQEGTFSDWFGYENGVGKPEGVVVHETASPNTTAATFAQSFNNNWETLETYVHAFTDDTQTINIHNTDYGVWGAGPTANSKYIQIELCEVNTADKFARSVANDAFYIATMLHKYNLPVEYGTTVVTHDQTAQWWHETDHTDPTGYFAKWGYGMDQFMPLIQKYYDQIGNAGSTAAGTDTTNNGGAAQGETGTVKVNNSSSFMVPLVSFDTAGNAKNANRGLANNTSWFTDQQKTYNGHTYYRVSTNEWVIDSAATYTAR
ncbi:peptidoglycan recognition protein family protein [Companilactobacillus sp.]|jgi:N-acetylmuramoyl-L-alanine amidase CwlA|uniref:peptidoglycan recognition protein family protein n=1 Tax=Companilactobacillus sp. TaxID=2767905 RepID=UPI0025BBE0EC|nr:peptidoglycan recognition family protein [Companilactobacillus sp.]MCH4009943.1 peptidoglycan recognition protein family protein [Companilactobacillus sp.]MCH4052381.1 peptidoglycan recognition protein family protein [Companilactobacillus sp.]MCH4077885.1 peptidoglycan recognition protein family protein [Companilactobacillus sp.]MCH4126461.1 peptidoglycan recognition protein family protein [Companilactobacillus sp.]MCH4132047.1 peptidoglycan recognition protein family protein [Companilactob